MRVVYSLVRNIVYFRDPIHGIVPLQNILADFPDETALRAYLAQPEVHEFIFTCIHPLHHLLTSMFLKFRGTAPAPRQSITAAQYTKYFLEIMVRILLIFPCARISYSQIFPVAHLQAARRRRQVPP